MALKGYKVAITPGGYILEPTGNTGSVANNAEMPALKHDRRIELPASAQKQERNSKEKKKYKVTRKFLEVQTSSVL